MTTTWNQLLHTLPAPHILQTWEWGQVKSRFGWRAFHLLWSASPGGEVLMRQWEEASSTENLQAAALLLLRPLSLRGLPLSLGVAYVPKGPLLDWRQSELRRRVLADLVSFARRQRAIFIKIDPDIPLGTGIPGRPEAHTDPLGEALTSELRAAGWRFSREQIQYRNTVLIDLLPSEEELLARMKQKTRYNIRYAARKGVRVRRAELTDLPLLYRMYAETSARDGFVIRPESYYLHLWQTFYQAEMLDPLIAEVEGEAVAGLFLFHFAQRAYYMHGMSRAAHRKKMPNHLLQWEAMRLARQRGCQVYDMWGAPDTFDESDPMWGVYRFKEGFGGSLVRHIGAWDLPLRPQLYRLYTRVLPALLSLMRQRSRLLSPVST